MYILFQIPLQMFLISFASTTYLKAYPTDNGREFTAMVIREPKAKISGSQGQPKGQLWTLLFIIINL